MSSQVRVHNYCCIRSQTVAKETVADEADTKKEVENADTTPVITDSETEKEKETAADESKTEDQSAETEAEVSSIGLDNRYFSGRVSELQLSAILQWNSKSSRFSRIAIVLVVERSFGLLLFGNR